MQNQTQKFNQMQMSRPASGLLGNITNFHNNARQSMAHRELVQNSAFQGTQLSNSLSIFAPTPNRSVIENSVSANTSRDSNITAQYSAQNRRENSLIQFTQTPSSSYGTGYAAMTKRTRDHNHSGYEDEQRNDEFEENAGHTIQEVGHNSQSYLQNLDQDGFVKVPAQFFIQQARVIESMSQSLEDIKQSMPTAKSTPKRIRLADRKMKNWNRNFCDNFPLQIDEDRKGPIDVLFPFKVDKSRSDLETVVMYHQDNYWEPPTLNNQSLKGEIRQYLRRIFSQIDDPCFMARNCAQFCWSIDHFENYCLSTFLEEREPRKGHFHSGRADIPVREKKFFRDLMLYCGGKLIIEFPTDDGVYRSNRINWINEGRMSVNQRGLQSKRGESGILRELPPPPNFVPIFCREQFAEPGNNVGEEEGDGRDLELLANAAVSIHEQGQEINVDDSATNRAENDMHFSPIRNLTVEQAGQESTLNATTNVVQMNSTAIAEQEMHSSTMEDETSEQTNRAAILNVTSNAKQINSTAIAQHPFLQTIQKSVTKRKKNGRGQPVVPNNEYPTRKALRNVKSLSTSAAQSDLNRFGV